MPGSRAVLEVLKYCSAADILLHLSCVDLHFSSLSKSHELWFELLGADYESSPSLSPQDQFRTAHTGFLPVLCRNNLLKFYVHSQTWQRILLSTQVLESRFLSLERMVDGRVFVTGAPTERDTFSVNPESGEVRELCPLQNHRSNIGLIRYLEDIYAFGGSGSSSDMRSSEVYIHSKQHWQCLPNSHYARFSFTPTEYKGHIYLLGGCKSAPGECFSVLTSTFHDLSIVLPGDNCTIALCTGSQLLAVQQDRYYVCKRETAGSWEMVKLEFDLGDGFWSSCRVIEANGCYYIHQSRAGKVVALRLKDRSFTEFPTSERPQYAFGDF